MNYNVICSVRGITGTPQRGPHPAEGGRGRASKKVCYSIGCRIQDKQVKLAICECRGNGCQDILTDEKHEQTGTGCVGNHNPVGRADDTG